MAGRGSQCRIVESYASPAGRASLTNAVTELVLEDGASVERCKLQQEGGEALHVATLAVSVGRDASFIDHSLVLGAALSRDDIDVRLEGEGASCELNGLFVVDGRRVADTHSRIDHLRPHGTSRELYKGILDDQARGVFNGLVVVHPGAQKTDAWQMNRNLLLSREALVHSTPQLEILANDVKCKHGSTTGQLDASALFYLRSRGIGEAAARGLLTWAFASDLLRRVPDAAVRSLVERQLQARLPGAAGLAGGGLVSSSTLRSATGFDVAAVRREFPVLRETVNGHPLVYLDSAASAQKPQAVIDAERAVYEHYYSNIHRGVHRLSTLATEAYEKARDTIGSFLGAASRREVVLLRGTTEAINLVAQSYGRRHVGAGDEVLITGPRAPLEHRSLAAAVRREAGARCGSRRSTTPARSTSPRSSGCCRRARRSWRSRTSRTRSARSTPCGA